jgi:hypothetical protein
MQVYKYVNAAHFTLEKLAFPVDKFFVKTQSKNIEDLKSIRVDLTPRGRLYLESLHLRSKRSSNNAQEKRADDLVRLLRAIEARVIGTIS